MRIFVINKQKDLKIDSAKVKQLVQLVVDYEKKQYDEVSIHLVDKRSITKLHQRFFSDPSPTDCISFPIDDNEVVDTMKILGDVFVCPRVAIEYAKKHHLDPYGELLLYIIHGLLHLMGYDDLEPNPRRRMRRAEKRHLENLDHHQISLKP